MGRRPGGRAHQHGLPQQCGRRQRGKVASDLRALLEGHHWSGKLLGILPTFYDARTRAAREAMAMLEKAFPGSLLPPVHQSTVFAAASAEGQTIFEYAEANPRNPYARRAAEEYRALVRAVLKAR